MLVVDASAVAELVLGRAPARAVERHVIDSGFDLHAPHLIDIEVVSAVRRVTAAGEASADRAAEAVTDLLDLPIVRYPHDILIDRVWELRTNFSAYDAAYVALAEALADRGAPLLTVDGRLARAVRRHTGVEVLVAGRR
jgi:predicted nucleic acid-binding protein